jgi:chitodextrinase
MHRTARAAVLLVTMITIFLPLGPGTRPAEGQTSTVAVTLAWTAPGDDGLIGRAARYDLRFSTTAISAADTLTWWNAASVFDMSGRVPAASGTADSVLVTGLTPATRYYFILRAADEVPNWSGFSNLAIVDTRDVIAPSRIADLRAR